MILPFNINAVTLRQIATIKKKDESCKDSKRSPQLH